MQEKIHSRLDLTSRWANEPAAVATHDEGGDDEGLRRTGRSGAHVKYYLRQGVFVFIRVCFLFVSRLTQKLPRESKITAYSTVAHNFAKLTNFQNSFTNRLSSDYDH